MNTVICNECGKEINPGLVSKYYHQSVCKRNAPNESISQYRKTKKMIESAGKYDKRKILFAPVFKKMSQKERNELFVLSQCSDVLKESLNVGSEAQMVFNRYKSDMIDKYSLKNKQVL